jgi:branched-subunit amino acid ABC-type transport system permease component
MTDLFLLTGGNIIQYTLNGLSRGLLYFLIASGLTLIFGLIGLINFAHGALFTLGGYFAITAISLTGSYWIGLLAAVFGVAAVGLALERLMLNRLYNEEPLLGFLATFGISIVIEEIITLIWGSTSRPVQSPFSGSVEILTITYSSHRLFVIMMGCVVAVIISAVLKYTRLGLEIHATAVDTNTAEVLGLHSKNIYTITFVAGAALAGLAGALTAPITSMYPGIGLNYLLIAFLIVIIGGMGSFKGSLLSSVIIGLLISFGSVFIQPSYVSIGIFILAMIFIIISPDGFFGRAEVVE